MFPKKCSSLTVKEWKSTFLPNLLNDIQNSKSHSTFLFNINSFSLEKYHGVRLNIQLFLLKCSIKMGNSLNLVGGSSAAQHSHLEHMYQGRTRDYQFELWSILICRAISEYIFHKQIYKKGIVNYQFRMWTILLCRLVSDRINDKLIYKKTISYAQFLLQSIKMSKSVSGYSHKPIYGKHIIYDQFQLWIILLWRTISQYIYCRPIYKKAISLDQFVNLPEVC